MLAKPRLSTTSFLADVSIAGQEDLGHAALGKLFEDLVVAQVASWAHRPRPHHSAFATRHATLDYIEASWRTEEVSVRPRSYLCTVHRTMRT